LDVRHRPLLTTLAAIFASFSRNVASDQCSSFSSRANVSNGS